MAKQLSMILKKEWLDITTTFFSRGNLWGGFLHIAFVSGLMSIYEPATLGPVWLHSPIMVFILVFIVPIIAVGFISPDSFVGERRRGTLEPLLATPISDQALLFGKVAIAGLYGWGIMLINMLLSLVTLNIIFAQGEILLYPLNMAIAVIVSGFLFSFLLSIGGVYYSLYARTLLEAQNSLGKHLFIPIAILALLVSPYTPVWWQSIIARTAIALGIINVFLILVVFLLLLDGVLMTITLARFQRKRLIF